MNERTRPKAEEVEAVMLGAQLLVAVAAQSLAAVESEVSLPQLRVLVILASRGPSSLNEVARSLGIHPSNATRACGKLADAGLISRREDPADRRLLHLSLTPAGERLLERVMDDRRRRIEELLAGVPSASRSQLATGLRLLATQRGDTLDQAAWQSGWATARPESR